MLHLTFFEIAHLAHAVWLHVVSQCRRVLALLRMQDDAYLYPISAMLRLTFFQVAYVAHAVRLRAAC